MKSIYIGDELELFSKASNWKNYWSKIVRPFLGTSVLEVGAGIGVSTQYLNKADSIERWLCLEPDPILASKIVTLKTEKQLPSNVEVYIQTLSTFKTSEKFNSVLYIDVIEHIEKDSHEFLLASDFLMKNGYLIVLVPAHNFLFSKFDKSLGHYRRYNKKMLSKIIPSGFEIIHLKYLDSIGFFVSLMNKFYLKQNYPTAGQIHFWDKFILPVSIILDKIIAYSFGKSIILIAKK